MKKYTSETAAALKARIAAFMAIRPQGKPPAPYNRLRGHNNRNQPGGLIPPTK